MHGWDVVHQMIIEVWCVSTGLILCYIEIFLVCMGKMPLTCVPPEILAKIVPP